MKSKKDAKRVRELGVLPEKIHVTGNVKFDTSSLNHIDDKNKSQLNSVFMIVFGSTRPGDEGTILRAFKKLLDDFPNLRCILAPRHMERIQEVEELIRSFGLSFVKQSELTVGEMTTPIILLDTVGDLIDYYKRSSLAFVGGGFNPRFGGHNILEPAACGKMVIYGKHMNNFEEESHLLTESGGGIQLTSPEDLYPTLHQLLDNPEELIKRGQSAFQTVLVNRGAVEKNKALIESFLL